MDNEEIKFGDYMESYINDEGREVWRKAEGKTDYMALGPTSGTGKAWVQGPPMPSGVEPPTLGDSDA